MTPQTTTLPYRAPRLAAVPSRLPSTAGAAVLPRHQLPPQPGQARIAPRPARSLPPATPPQRGVWTDRTAWLATVDGRTLQLTYLEFEVLDFFVHNPGMAHSRESLLTSVWGRRPSDTSAPDVRTVDVLVTRLRRKLGPEHRFRIETIRRVGYRYRPADADALHALES